jgi:hypothetical protein
MENEKYPYQKEWKNRREGNALGCLMILIIIPAIAFGRDYLPELPNYVGGIAFILFYGCGCGFNAF